MNVSSAYYSDPTFTVFRVPTWRAFFYKFLSLKIWGNLPSPIQRSISKGYSSLYNRSFSKFLIKPYLRLNYSNRRYLEKFQPPDGKQDFETFQDFFIRRFRSMPKNESDWVWPCEGLLCEEEAVETMKIAHIKCDVRSIDTVFGLKHGEIPKSYAFTNVFLHNKNYHRIHSPINGTIERIQHVPGDLVVLRPWIYKQNPSLPAFRNERYNIDIKDAQGRIWYLSIVGGPAVGTIALDSKVKVGAKVEKVSELALFYLGSTCCMAAPIKPRFHQKNTFVEVGMSY